jgi:hypothetical protein
MKTPQKGNGELSLSPQKISVNGVRFDSKMGMRTPRKGNGLSAESLSSPLTNVGDTSPAMTKRPIISFQ